MQQPTDHQLEHFEYINLRARERQLRASESDAKPHMPFYIPNEELQDKSRFNVHVGADSSSRIIFSLRRAAFRDTNLGRQTE